MPLQHSIVVCQLFESSDTGYSSYGRTTTEVYIVLVLPLLGLRALRRVGVDRAREEAGPRALLGALQLRRRVGRAYGRSPGRV